MPRPRGVRAAGGTSMGCREGECGCASCRGRAKRSPPEPPHGGIADRCACPEGEGAQAKRSPRRPPRRTAVVPFGAPTDGARLVRSVEVGLEWTASGDRPALAPPQTLTTPLEGPALTVRGGLPSSD